MTGGEARRLLRNWPGVGQFEAWIAEQDWQVVPDGWTVTSHFQNWSFQLEVIPAGLRISASAPGGCDPAVWVVTQ
jgi:hypothetical protein